MRAILYVVLCSILYCCIALFFILFAPYYIVHETRYAHMVVYYYKWPTNLRRLQMKSFKWSKKLIGGGFRWLIFDIRLGFMFTVLLQ